MAIRGYYRRNPLVSYCVLYLLLAAIGVAGLRSDMGLMLRFSLRYRIYSALLLIFAWFAIVEEFLSDPAVSPRRNRILLPVIVCTALFSLSMDTWGWFYLTERNRRTVLGMAAFEHPVPGEASNGPGLQVPDHDARFDLLARRAPEILKRSMELDIYEPQLTSGNEPAARTGPSGAKQAAEKVLEGARLVPSAAKGTRLQ